MEDMDGTVEQTAPVWAVFGDLMSGLLGAFILILVGVLGVQLELASKLRPKSSSAKLPNSGARRWKKPWLGHWHPGASP